MAQKEGSILVAPYAAATSVQNGNKCPHGLPPGACPICSGMGGGSMRKDRDKPRVPGEMTYAECMAAWIKIQAAQEAKIQAQIQKVEQAQARLLENKIMMAVDKANQALDKFMQKLDQMPQVIALPVKIVINVIVKPILNLIAKIPQAINNIQAFFSNIAQFISSVGEKLASVLGEVKNFIDAKISQPIKKAIKTVLAFFSQGQEEESEETEKIKAREIKQILKGLFRIKRNPDREVEKEENENESI